MTVKKCFAIAVIFKLAETGALQNSPLDIISSAFIFGNCNDRHISHNHTATNFPASR
jgi:hypothetical protein